MSDLIDILTYVQPALIGVLVVAGFFGCLGLLAYLGYHRERKRCKK